MAIQMVINTDLLGYAVNFCLVSIFAEGYVMNSKSAEVFISHSLVRDSKQFDASRANFKKAIAGIIDSGHKVAAFEDETTEPSIVFQDSESFVYWYENFYRIQGWFVQ
jgi:hypothetical protein